MRMLLIRIRKAVHMELRDEYKEKVTDVLGERYVPNSWSGYAEGSRFKKYHGGEHHHAR